MAEEWTIYNNEKPWGLLTDEQRAVFSAMSELLFLDGTGNWVTWSSLKNKLWPHLTYRAVRPAPTKPSINWAHVADWVKWIGVSQEGHPFGCECKPGMNPNGTFSLAYVGRITDIRGFASYVPGSPDLDWKDSLVSRPGTEGADAQ